MAEREILHLGHPILWKKSIPVEDASAPAITSLVKDLDDTLAAFRRDNGFGRGISAPQIGVLKQVVFVRMPDNGFAGALINPEIMWESEDKVQLWDACFSLPNLSVKVERAARLRVEYLDETGTAKTLEAKGDLSELLQHEIDHLHGILAVQRAVDGQSFSTYTEWDKHHSEER